LTVIILENAPPALRGLLTRWMLEVRAGVYVGTLATRVRDLLWERVEQTLARGKGNAVLVWSARNEQGFCMRTLGENARTIFDIDGLSLVRRTRGSSQTHQEG
jgi:CRISPR-associated protein Cas2